MPKAPSQTLKSRHYHSISPTCFRIITTNFEEKCTETEKCQHKIKLSHQDEFYLVQTTFLSHQDDFLSHQDESDEILSYCPACRTYEIATRFWVVVICPIIKCLTVLEFSFILFDLCLFITIFNFILNYVLIVTFWIFTYHKIWILLIIYGFIWNYWIIHFLTCLEVFWSIVS